MLSTYVDFRRWALHKVQHMKWIWSRMWNIRRIPCRICQNLYPVKVPFFCKGFGLQVIGNPTTPRLHYQPLLLVLIQRTQSNIFIVYQRTWSLQLHTPCSKILMMGILFWWGRMILTLFMFGWENHKVMLWRLKKLNFSKWSRFNGGFLWRKA